MKKMMKWKKIISLILVCAMLSVLPTDYAGAAVSKRAKKLAKVKYKSTRTYHAYIGLQQTENWIFRDPWYSATLGIGGSDLKKYHVNYKNVLQMQISGYSSGIRKSKGKVKDTNMKGSGTYTVSITGLKNTLRKNPYAVLSMVYVNTDIPYKALNKVDISNVKLYMDNKLVYRTNHVYIPDEYCSESKFIRFDVINQYQKDSGDYTKSPNCKTPRNSIKIKFKIKMKK